jgi:hypothetical protein
MQHEAFQNWRSERETIEAEMNGLLQMGPIISSEDRRIRTMRFMALVERRDEAARDLLETVRRSSSRRRFLPREPRESFIADETELLPATGYEAQAASIEGRESQHGAQPPERAVDDVSIATRMEQRPMIPEAIAAFMRSLLK